MQRPRTTIAERAEWLERSSLFGDLAPAERTEVARAARAERFAAEETLFYQGAPAASFYLVVSGTVRVLRSGAQGRDQILHVMGAGEVVGEAPVFEGGVYPATAVATAPAACLAMDRARFLEAARKRPEVLLKMLAILSRRLRGFVHLIDDLALKEVSARVAKYLLDLQARAGGRHVRLEGSKAALASRLGTVAETLSRTLGKMQRRGMLTVAGRDFEIRDREALLALAAGAKL